MRIVTVQFDTPDRNTYEKLYVVFRRSLEQYMPDVPVDLIQLEAPAREKNQKYGFLANTIKLKAWVDYLEERDEGDEIIFSDCDMMALQSAYHAFDEDFDVAYTRRKVGDRVPINNGILMVRVNERSKAFFREWLRINDVMFYEDKDLHAKWKKKYPGMNQAAFGYMLEEGRDGTKLHEYSTREWNAVECDWPHIGGKTVFVHFKGQLRRKVFSGARVNGVMSDVVSMWYRWSGFPTARRHVPARHRTRKASVRKVLNAHRRAGIF